MKNILNTKLTNTITFFSACCLSASFAQADFREEVVKEWLNQNLIKVREDGYFWSRVITSTEEKLEDVIRHSSLWLERSVMPFLEAHRAFLNSSIEALQVVPMQSEGVIRPKGEDFIKKLAEGLEEGMQDSILHSSEMLQPIQDLKRTCESLAEIAYKKLPYQLFMDKMNRLMECFQEATQAVSSLPQQKSLLAAKLEEIGSLLNEVDSLQKEIECIEDSWYDWRNCIQEKELISNRVMSSVVWENLQFSLSQIMLMEEGQKKLKEVEQVLKKQDEDEKEDDVLVLSLENPYGIVGLDMGKVQFSVPYGQEEAREKQVAACIKEQGNVFQKDVWEEGFFSQMWQWIERKMDEVKEVFNNSWGLEDSDAEEEFTKKTVSKLPLVATCKKSLFQYGLKSFVDQQFSSLAEKFSKQLKSLKRERGIYIHRECRNAIVDGQVKKWKSKYKPVTAYMRACDEVLIHQAEMFDWIREKEMQRGNDQEADRKKVKEWNQVYQKKVTNAQKAEEDFLKILDDRNKLYVEKYIKDVLKKIKKLAEPLFNRLEDYGLLAKEEVKPADNQKEIAKDPFQEKKNVFSTPQPQLASSNVASSGRVRRTKKAMEAFQQQKEEEKK